MISLAKIREIIAKKITDIDIKYTNFQDLSKYFYGKSDNQLTNIHNRKIKLLKDLLKELEDYDA